MSVGSQSKHRTVGSTPLEGIAIERPAMLIETLLCELGGYLGLSVKRDVSVMRQRLEHEGLPFLTMVLPTVSDALEQGIEDGRVTRDMWGGHFALPSRGCLPLFLRGFTTRVFHLDGRLLDDPCVESINAIRQVCRIFKKLRIGCSPEKNRAATEKFINVESELRSMTENMWKTDHVLDRVAGIIWSRVFPEIDPLDLISRHGPGATAEKKKLNERLQITHWYDRSELFFPSDLHVIHNYSYHKELAKVEYLGVNEELPVRVVFVPKTAKTPRVIAIEPSHVQYMQQGLMAYCVPKLESHPLTRKSVHFTDQSINNDAARRASIDKQYATIDLSDASDRVHLDLVRRIFRNGGLLDYLEASRSLYAQLPDAREVILSKFASMGSAMCFPVEAMVFYTLIQSAVHHHTGIRPSYQSVRNISNYVHVYGDDIIVPVPWLDCVVSTLEAYGLKVNRSKSFSRSQFRESCGGDYFNGVSVKPVYAREVPYDDITAWTPTHFMSWTKTADQFYLVGLWSTCQLIREWIEERLGSVPRSPHEIAGLGFYSVSFTTMCRYDTKLHNFRQKRWIFQPVRQKDPVLTPVSFFLKALKPERKERLGPVDYQRNLMIDVDDVVLDLESSVRRGAFKPKRRWVAV